MKIVAKHAPAITASTTMLAGVRLSCTPSASVTNTTAKTATTMPTYDTRPGRSPSTRPHTTGMVVPTNAVMGATIVIDPAAIAR